MQNHPPHALPAPQQRLQQIAQARQAVLVEGRSLGTVATVTDASAARLGSPSATPLAAPWQERAWIERSWRRCLADGRRPDEALSFELVAAAARKRALEASRQLVAAAQPVLSRLGRAIANTHYFAILTNAQGVVIDTHGPIDTRDPRARLITRIGVDLSEKSVGTTAIGAVLAELQPVWLHRGEHFFNDTSAYSCAGAPLFGPDGTCVGMLDVTGIDAPERPELQHLVAQSARSIENEMVLSQPHRLALRLNWPGREVGDDSDGLLCLDDDGWVCSANGAARQMIGPLNQQGGTATPSAAYRVHCSELFAMPWENLFDQARRGSAAEVPLWSGLRLSVVPSAAAHLGRPHALLNVPGATTPVARRAANASTNPPVPLKAMEAELIRQAVDAAQGNVMQAARALGISRATVYRKLGPQGRKTR